MIERNSSSIYVNEEYKTLVKEYLNLFVPRQVELFGKANDGGQFSGTGGKGLVKRLYGELKGIVDAYNFGKFTNWLKGNLQEDDFDDVYCLYMAVFNVDTYGMYSAKREGDNIIVKANIGDEKLILRGDSEQQKFLDYLDGTYGEDIGVEALYSFNKALEKND